MTISVNASALKAALNSASPGVLADMFRAMGLGDFVRSMPTRLRNKNPGAVATNPYVAAAAQCLTLPDDAKALFIYRAYARVGTGTAGPLTIDSADAYTANANPAASHIVVGPTGDLLMHGADAWTSIDVVYLPEKYDIKESTLPVTAGNTTWTPPASFGEVLSVLEVEAILPTDTKLIVDPPGTAPAAGHAALDLAKATVQFHAADAVTSARVKYAVASAIDVDALLEAVSNFI
jgi:hypothetical protein